MRVLIVVFSSMLLAAACASPFGGGSDDSSGGASGGLVTSALEDLPQITNDGSFEIRIADIDAAAELLGIGSDPVEGRLRTVVFPSPRSEGGPGFIISLPQMFRFAPDDESLQADAGFVLDDVQRVAEVTDLPHTATVIVGPAAWGGRSEPHGDGLLTLGQGEDLRQDPALRSSLDPLGRPIRMAEADGVLASSFSTSVMQGWLDGTGARYTDDERVAPMAAELDRYDVVAAVLFVGGNFVSPLPIPDLDESIDDFSERIAESGEAPFIDQPFLALGIGNTIRDGQAIEVVTYRFFTDESAEAAMASIEAVWTTGELSSGDPVSRSATFDSIERNGPVVTVVVTIPDDQVGRGLSMLASREPPFSHG